MAQEVKYNANHHAGATPEARIANRLRNSGGEGADHHAVHGTGPTRTHSNIHNSGSAKRHGSPNEGEVGIDGAKRGVVRTGDGK
jgi:hypothetical protein